MVDSVRLRFPEYDVAMVKRDINDSVRTITSRRAWSGLLQQGVLQTMAAYNTGTVTLTPGSNVVTGSGTSWPTDDSADTTLSEATIESNAYIDFTPVSMSGIQAGVYVLIDAGLSNQEAVFVISTTQTTFRAYCVNTHDAGETVTRSSRAGQQIRTQPGQPFMTVTGVVTATSLLINMNWGGSLISNHDYSISQVYVSLGQDVKQILTMVNPQMTYRFAVDVPQIVLNQRDAQRSATQWSFALSYLQPDPGGSPLYEIYPRPTTVQQFPYIYMRAWSPMSDNNAILPNGIRSDVLVKMAMAAAARWPGHKIKAGGIYYDPKLAESYLREVEREIEFMKEEDDSTAMMQLLWQYNSWRVGAGGGPDWNQSHDWASMAV
jgi:hypothetical protein